MKIFIKILRGISHVCAWIVYFFIGVYILCCIPMLFGYHPLVVLSGSMEPHMNVGSLIYYHAVSQDEIEKGDIVTFELDNQYISHRIYGIIEDGKYETKGDANNTVDPVKITYDQIKGKVYEKNIPYVGYYIQFVNEHIYTIVIAVVILVSEFLLGTIDIDKIGKKGEKSYEERQQEE